MKIVLTLGGEGSIYQDENQSIHQEIYKVKVVDTTAAGDTFSGYFIAAMIQGDSVKRALDYAARAAAITVSRAGAAASIPYKDEISECN